MNSPRAAAALALLLAAGCWSRPFRGEEGAPRAVILSAAEDDALSLRLASALHEAGYDVLRKSTTIPRARTTVGIYDVRNHAERIDEVAKIVKDVGVSPAEILPFPQHATGGNSVVVWLGDDSRK